MKTIKNERGQEVHQTCLKILEARKQMNKWELKRIQTKLKFKPVK